MRGPFGSVTAIAAGEYHTCAIVNGTAWCWGRDAEGELGSCSAPVCDGEPWSCVPIQVCGLTSGVTAIVADCAIVNGAAWCWSGNSVPVPVSGTAIAVGGSTCAVVNCNLECWGDNSYGQLGNNSTTNSNVPVAVLSL